MNRLGLLEKSQLNASQRECYNIMDQYTTQNYGSTFRYADEQGRLLGPFGIHMHYPELGKAFIAFAKALRTIPGFPAEVRECAILGVGCRLQAAYEQYAHERLSGFSEKEQDTLHSGSCPDHFSAAQKIAFKVAIDLGQPGPLDHQTWEEAVAILGVQGAAALVHYVGFYSYVSTILNGFDAQVPA